MCGSQGGKATAAGGGADRKIRKNYEGAVRSCAALGTRRWWRTTPPPPPGGDRCAGSAGLAPRFHARFPVGPIEPVAARLKTTYSAWSATLSRMTVRELLAELQHLPRDLEVLAFEAGCEDYCEREVDELELQGGRVYLHLGARRDEPPRR